MVEQRVDSSAYRGLRGASRQGPGGSMGSPIDQLSVGRVLVHRGGPPLLRTVTSSFVGPMDHSLLVKIYSVSMHGSAFD